MIFALLITSSIEGNDLLLFLRPTLLLIEFICLPYCRPDKNTFGLPIK